MFCEDYESFKLIRFEYFEKWLNESETDENISEMISEIYKTILDSGEVHKKALEFAIGKYNKSIKKDNPIEISTEK
jgi:hypothetical protein